MASGSYMPPPVREKRIPKGDGKERKLGIPTILDRVAQQVIRAELEEEVEPRFHPDSYGYRPGRSAHDALKQCHARCRGSWYVIDLDIRAFFDTIDHETMLSVRNRSVIPSFCGMSGFASWSLHTEGFDGRFGQVASGASLVAGVGRLAASDRASRFGMPPSDRSIVLRGGHRMG